MKDLRDIKNRTRYYNAIRNDLLAQLEARNNATKETLDLVQVYCELLRVRDELFDDIRERGAKVLVATASTENIKTNDSVKSVTDTVKQMVGILSALHLNEPPEVEEAKPEM